MTSRRISPAKVFVRGFGFSEGLEWGVWLALTVFWIVELDLSPARLVFLAIALETTALLSETPTGVVADLYSRRRSLIIAQLLMGLALVWAFSSTNYWALMPAQVLFGFGWTFRSGADTAWVTDEMQGWASANDDNFSDGEVESILLQKHRVGMMFSLLIGPATIAAGWFWSVRGAGIVLGLLYAAMAGWMALVMTEENFTPGRDREAGFRQTLTEGFAVVRSRPRLRVLVVVAVLMAMGSVTFDRLGYVHFLDNLGVDELQASGQSMLAIGIIFFVAALGGIAVSLITQRQLDAGRGVVRVGVGLFLFATIGGAVAAATSAVVLIGLGMLLQDSVREATWPIMEAWANRDAPSEVRATVHSMIGQTSSIGEIGGGVLFGVIAEATNVPVALAGAATFFAMATAAALQGVDK